MLAVLIPLLPVSKGALGGFHQTMAWGCLPAPQRLASPGTIKKYIYIHYSISKSLILFSTSVSNLETILRFWDYQFSSLISMQRKVNIFGYFVVPKILQSADYLYGLSHLNVAMERENQDIHSKEYMVTTFEIARL